MARRKTAPAPAVPTAAKVEVALRAADFPDAVRLARELHALAPTAENLVLRKRALAAAAGFYSGANRFADFNHVLAEADALDPADPAWAFERAVMLVGGGNVAEALRRAEALTEPGAKAKVLGHVADRAIKVRSKEMLPPDHRPGYDAVLAAFEKYEAGGDDAAREALQAIGLQSPFLDWKVLLRGLIAYSAGDDAKAAENWQRLDPHRLPARLAAPLRLAVDPAYKASLPPESASALAARGGRLASGPVVDGLKKVQAELGRDKPLTAAFRHAEAVLPALKSAAPHLVPRLANTFYHAILDHGQPEDLGKHRRLFGAPADDPHFDRLQALVGEATRNWPDSHRFWQKYEAWLAANPAGWPPAVAARARAEVWARMGENARHAADEEDEDDDFPFGNPFAAPRRRRKPPALNPPPADCFRKAIELAPDWSDPARSLFALFADADKLADAEAVARGLLARKPDDLHALEALALLVQGQGRAAEAAELWVRALAVNPLDRRVRLLTAFARLAEARKLLTAGDAAAAEALLAAHRTLIEPDLPAALFALSAIVALKLGKADDSSAARDRALAVPGGRLGAAYRMMVDAQLAKLKPAVKKPFDALFKDEMAKTPTPLEANQLVAAYDNYMIDGVTFRGQKTHEKKVLDHAQKCVTADAPEEDFERLCEVLLQKHEWKRAQKLAVGCGVRFPRNPYFALAEAEAMAETNTRPYHVERIVGRAKRLADDSREPRHKALHDRIEALRKEFASPFEILGDLFGR